MAADHITQEILGPKPGRSQRRYPKLGQDRTVRFACTKDNATIVVNADQVVAPMEPDLIRDFYQAHEHRGES